MRLNLLMKGKDESLFFHFNSRFRDTSDEIEWRDFRIAERYDCPVPAIGKMSGCITLPLNPAITSELVIVINLKRNKLATTRLVYLCSIKPIKCETLKLISLVFKKCTFAKIKKDAVSS